MKWRNIVFQSTAKSLRAAPRQFLNGWFVRDLSCQTDEFLWAKEYPHTSCHPPAKHSRTSLRKVQAVGLPQTIRRVVWQTHVFSRCFTSSLRAPKLGSSPVCRVTVMQLNAKGPGCNPRGVNCFHSLRTWSTTPN